MQGLSGSSAACIPILVGVQPAVQYLPHVPAAFQTVSFIKDVAFAHAFEFLPLSTLRLMVQCPP